MTEIRQRRRARVALSVAAAAGCAHAAASGYWALGGRWQLRSVGEWAVTLADDHRLLASIALGVLAVVKLAAALVPLFGSDRRPVRIVSWCGAVVLVLWGGASTVAAWSVLAGVVAPDGGYDSAAMIGHAFVWDPLFTLWGSALLAGLWFSRGVVRPHAISSRRSR